MDEIQWNVQTYETKTGGKPVDDFFRKQQPTTSAKIIHAIRLLRTYGNLLGMPHAKSIGSGLYELRIRGKTEIRIFYYFKQRTIILIHAMKKQTQKIPKKEIEIAKNRMIM